MSHTSNSNEKEDDSSGASQRPCSNVMVIIGKIANSLETSAEAQKVQSEAAHKDAEARRLQGEAALKDATTREFLVTYIKERSPSLDLRSSRIVSPFSLGRSTTRGTSSEQESPQLDGNQSESLGRNGMKKRERGSDGDDDDVST